MPDHDLLLTVTMPRHGGSGAAPMAASPCLALDQIIAHAMRVTSTDEDCARLACRMLANQAVHCAGTLAAERLALGLEEPGWKGRDAAAARGNAVAMAGLATIANPPRPVRIAPDPEMDRIHDEARVGRERDVFTEQPADEEAA